MLEWSCFLCCGLFSRWDSFMGWSLGSSFIQFSSVCFHFYPVSSYGQKFDSSWIGVVEWNFLRFFDRFQERKFSRDGSGIVLFLYFVSMCALFPVFVTGSHKITNLTVIHESNQLQRALKFAIFNFSCCVLAIVAQSVPDKPCKKSDSKILEGEETASLLPRIFFQWFRTRY